MRRNVLILAFLSMLTVGCSDIEIPVLEDDVQTDTGGNTGSCETDSDCDDQNSCTANRCNDGQCVFPPAQDICVIDDACIQAGSVQETDQCLICDPERDSSGWSGRLCDDNNPQTKDSCGSAVGCFFEPINECPEGHALPDCDECLSGWQDNDEDGSCQPACDSADLECGDYGACDDASGLASCVCDAAYQGDNCGECAPTHQDNDGDGSCLATCETAALLCGEGGSCEDSSGTALCKCADGLTGEFCDGCDDGFQDKDGDGVCLPACSPEAIDCGNNGLCDDSSGSPTCVCNEGYVGEGCGACDDGFQDNNQDGICLPSCNNPQTSCVNGTCNDDNGSVSCKCDNGWSGETCETCNEGFVLVGGNCVPACNPADCGQHEVCGDANQCVCVPGFKMQGGSCAWIGVGLDSQLNDPDAWTTEGTASVEDGVALFPLACEWGSIKTKITMPEYANALPIRVKLSLLSNQSKGCLGQDCVNIPLFIKFNGHTNNFQHDTLGDNYKNSPAYDDPETASFCLPPSGYGGEVEIEIFNGPPLGQFGDFVCGETNFATWAVNAIELLPTDTNFCPPPGTIGDSKFDKQDQSWTLTSSSGDSSAFMAKEELVLKTYTPCAKSTAFQDVMSPGDPQGADKSLALVFDYKATENAEFQVTVGGLNRRRLEGKGADKTVTQTLCLNKPFVASEIPLLFELGSCAEDNKTEAYLDNVRFEYVEGCEHTDYLSDGGFEAAATGFETWGIYGFDDKVLFQGANVKSGLAAAQINTNTPCYEHGIFTWFTVPSATTEAGPALTFAYYFPESQHAVPKVTIGEAYGPWKLNKAEMGFKQEIFSNTLKENGGWGQHKVCLDPQSSGRRARLKIGLFGGAGVCNSNYPIESMWVDDVTIGLDPGCKGL